MDPRMAMGMNMEMIEKAPDIKCPCGCIYWLSGNQFKFIHKLMSGTGKNELYPMPVSFCAGCGEPLTEDVVNAADTSTPDKDTGPEIKIVDR